jgi:hypothetical protein
MAAATREERDHDENGEDWSHHRPSLHGVPVSRSRCHWLSTISYTILLCVE